jgi:voltage-dependent anion channel protein 2
MAPPKFSDLDKKFRDLSKDDFGFGTAKLTFKSKTANGVNIKAEGSRKFDDGSVTGALEVKYTNAAHGLTIKDNWDTKNVCKTEISFEGTPIGNKFTVSKTVANGGSLVSGWVGKHEFSSKTATTEASFDGQVVSGSAVANFSNYNVGASAAYDSAKGTLKSLAFGGSFTVADTIFNATVTNGSDVAASIYHTPSTVSAVGIEFGWKGNGADTTFGLVTKYDLDASSFVKASIDKKLTTGFSYTQKLRQGVSLTLAAQVDGANLTADAHRLGASLTFEN